MERIKQAIKTGAIRIACALGCWLLAIFMPLLILVCLLNALLIGLPRATFGRVGAKAFIIDRYKSLAGMVKITWYLLILDIDKAYEMVEL